MFYSEMIDARTIRAVQCKQGQGIQQQLMEQGLSEVCSYARTCDCKRVTLLWHFGEVLMDAERACTILECSNCSSCGVHDGAKELDVTKEDVLLFSLMQTSSCTSTSGLVGILRGSNSAKVSQYVSQPLHGAGRGHSADWWKALVLALQPEWLQVSRNINNGAKYCSSYLTLTASAMECLGNPGALVVLICAADSLLFK